MFRIIKIVFLRSFYAIKKTMSYTYEYPHPSVATDCVVFGFSGRSLEILLVERGIEPFKGAWAFPGGFLQIDETAEACARRELAEETGLQIQSLKQLGAFTGVHRDPRERVISIAFYALVRPSEVRGGDDASNARWFPIEDAPPLAFDHDYILRKAQQQLRKDIHFEPVGFDLLDPAFTMSELQRVYEQHRQCRRLRLHRRGDRPALHPGHQPPQRPSASRLLEGTRAVRLISSRQGLTRLDKTYTRLTQELDQSWTGVRQLRPCT